jgi:hypothetical protein
MRKQFGQALRIGVSNRCLALVKTSRWRGDALAVLAEHVFISGDVQTPQSIAQGLRNLLVNAGVAGWPVTIVLADELVRMWQVTPPQGSTRLGDLEAAAAQRFQLLYGEPASGWAVSASYEAARPFLAAAVARPLLEVCEQAAAEHEFALIEIVPQFVAGWNRWRHAVKPGAWFGQVHERVLTIGAPGAGALSTVRAAAVPDGADHAWLREHVGREALRLNLPQPDHLHLTGRAPAAWSQADGQSPLSCSALGDAPASHWSNAVALASTGSRR